MSMKKILMTAVAVSALSAGAANAAKISIVTGTGSSVGSAPTYLHNTDSGTTGVAEAYTLPSELITTSTSDIASSIVIAPTAAGIPAGDYLVTFSITGGTWKIATAPTFSGTVTTTAPATTITGVLSNATATTVTALFSVVGTGTVSTFKMVEPILLGTSKSPVSVSARITNQAGTAIDGGDVAAQTIIDYRAGYKFKATKNSPVLTLLSGFKDFTAQATYDNIGTLVGFVPNTGLDATFDVVYSDNAATPLSTSLLTSAKLTVAGSTTAFKIQATDVARGNILAADTGTTDTISVTTATAASTAVLASLVATADARIALAQKTPTVAGVESAYSVTPTVTVATGGILTAPVFTSKALGTVTFAGETLYAPWVSDGANGINYTIRLASTGSDVGTVRVGLLNPTAITAPAAYCPAGTLAANGELLITSASLKSCFGDFGRSDVVIIVNGSATGSISAKMRAASANNTVVADVPLGLGVTAAKAN